MLLAQVAEAREIDDGVKVSGSANPLIDSLPVCLAGRAGMVVTRTTEGQNGCAKDFDVVRMSARNHLLVSGNHVVDEGIVVGLWDIVITSKHTDVVDSFEHHQITNAGLRDDVMIEAGESIWPETIEQKTIAADAVIQHCN